jgi:diguanylate cyclase (GGDEF)-like protein
MIRWNSWIWIVVLLSIRGLIELLPISGGHDFFGLFITVLIIAIAWYYLGFRTQLMSFLLGIFLLLLAGIFDWLDGLMDSMTTAGVVVDVLDDLCLSTGIFFIGLGFIRVMLERDQLEAKLFQQAYIDELTGLGNRRALFAKLDEVIHAQSGALLYIDVNNFKHVNDTAGHEQGDLVLRECAVVLRTAHGQSYRIGGDEFALLLDQQAPEVVRTQLQSAIQPLHAKYGIGFSIGIASFAAQSFDNPDALITHADSAMYAEKQRFRAQQRPAQAKHSIEASENSS